MKNRDSAHPGRIKLTPVDAANGIYDLTRADEPRDPGTPLNKKLLDYAVAACGVTAGTATAYTLDDEFGGFELVDGAKINFRLHVASGKTPTLNVNGTGEKFIVNQYGVPLMSSISTYIWMEATYSEGLDAYVTAIPDAEYGGGLDALSWERIEGISKLGVAESAFQIGDEKNIIVNGEPITLVIVGFNHDDKSDGTGKAGITFGMKNLMSNTRPMNDTQTNIGGFTGSDMYHWMTNILYPSLPDELKNVIKNVNKKTSAGNKSNIINTDAMKLFLFSEIELGFPYTNSVQGEGAQYSYFATTESRKKALSNGAGDYAWWWTRSPVKDSNSSFCAISEDGSISYSSIQTNANYVGVCFGFCV